MSIDDAQKKMTRENLISKLNELEWEDFEVKEASSQIPKSAWETVSSFANSSGGWLVFGVKQNNGSFVITGVANPEKIEQDFLATLRGGQKFNVPVSPVCEKYQFDKKVILAFYIPISSHKPVYFNSVINTFIRKGSADQRATKVEIDYLYRDQAFGTKTSELIAHSSIEGLKRKSIEEYRGYMSRFNPNVSYNRMSLEDFLVKLRVLDKDTRQCTFGGMLFFGNRDNIEKCFPDFLVDVLEIPGSSYQDAILRYTYRLSEDDYENLWEAYFECFSRLRKTVDVSFTLTEKGFGEELSPGLNAIRETLVNMLMHTDYFSPAHPRIRIFNNHVEYYNPGGLPKPLKEIREKDISLPRNPIIAKLFRMVKLAENAGYGFDKIESNWKEYNQTIPEYSISFDSVTIKLYLDKQEKRNNVLKELNIYTEWKDKIGTLQDRLGALPNENILILRGIYGVFTGYLRGIYGIKEELEERSIFILLLIEAFPVISKQEMGAILGISLSTVEKAMQKIRKMQLIKREGSDKTGYWKIAGRLE